MSPLLDQLQGIWGHWEDALKVIRSSERKEPSRVTISPDHIHNENEEVGAPFIADKDYFQVRVNDMYLPYDRLWFKKYDPMVVVVTEFNYGRDKQGVPYVVGPSLMEKYGYKAPAGMVFSDTRVAGLHPFRGGELSLSIILCMVERDNYCQKLLQLVESAAGALDFSTVLSSYIKVASVVLGGIETLFGLGKTVPLIGSRRAFDQQTLKSGYFALISTPDVDPNLLWVKDRQLCMGASLKEAKSLRQPRKGAEGEELPVPDFVLYSLTQRSDRDDLSTLPFYGEWERVRKEAMIPKDDDPWDNARLRMASLAQDMLLSPDLTEKHAEKLVNDFDQQMRILHKDAVRRAQRGELGVEPSELESVRSRALEIMKSK